MPHPIIGMHIVEAREFLYWNQGKELVCLTGNPRREWNPPKTTVECLVDKHCRVSTVLTPITEHHP